MQKDFGGGNKFGFGGNNNGGNGKKKSRSILLIILIVVIVVIIVGAVLYMMGVFDSFTNSNQAPVSHVARRVAPNNHVSQETPINMDNNDGNNANANGNTPVNANMANTDNGTANINANSNRNIGNRRTQPPAGDIFETDSGKQLDNQNSNGSSHGQTVSKSNIQKHNNGYNSNTATRVQRSTPSVAKVNPSPKKLIATRKVVSKPVRQPVSNGSSVVVSVGKPHKTYYSSVKHNKKVVARKHTGMVQKPKVKRPVHKVTIDDRLTYTALIAQGDEAADQNDYAKAIDLFKKAAKIENSNALMGNIASLYIKEGKPGSASEMVIVNKLKDPDIISGLVVDMASVKYYVQALVLIKYAKDNMPFSGQMVYALGYYYEMQQMYEKAAILYQKASEMDPTEPSYIYAYARCLDLKKQYYKALEAYTKVVSMNPDNSLKIYSQRRIRSLEGYLRQVQ